MTLFFLSFLLRCVLLAAEKSHVRLSLPYVHLGAQALKIISVSSNPPLPPAPHLPCLPPALGSHLRRPPAERPRRCLSCPGASFSLGFIRPRFACPFLLSTRVSRLRASVATCRFLSPGVLRQLLHLPAASQLVFRDVFSRGFHAPLGLCANKAALSRRRGEVQRL